MNQYDVDVAIIGAGTAGMAAYREAHKHTDRLALIDGGTLGTTCARVGCMPSKLLIAAADAAHHIRNTDQFGIRSQLTEIDGKAVMKRVRDERDRFVGFVLESVDGFDDGHLIREQATFVDDHTLLLSTGRQLTAGSIIIAVGSRPAIPPPFEVAGDRLIVNDDIFYWNELPSSVVVFGAGVIGLELGQALHRLGVRVKLFGREHGVGPLSDPEVIKYAAQTFSQEFDAHWHADTQIKRVDDRVVVHWKDENGEGEEAFDYLLAATGRRSNNDSLRLENTTIPLSERGIPLFDELSGRAGETNIFIAGDATADRPILHEAADEGRLAGENAARFPHVYRRARRANLGIVFSNPQIGLAGKSYRELTENSIEFETGSVSFEDQGRSRVMGVNQGLLHVYAQKDTGQLLGAEMIGPAAEHLAHLLAWAIQGQQSVEQILQNPFYHPVIEEGLRSALRDVNSRLGFGPNPPLRCIDCGPGA
jgi:dihydrolipoamide dehydrogenase